MWEKREAEWRRESSARQKLMNEVLNLCTSSTVYCPGILHVEIISSFFLQKVPCILKHNISIWQINSHAEIS